MRSGVGARFFLRLGGGGTRVDRVLAGFPFVFVYLDDIIVTSKSLEQHGKDVEEVFRRLRSAGLVINGGGEV
jgi:hypothetical protein